jgi:hypothetical protein
MQLTAEFNAAIEAHQVSVGRLTDVLAGYREAGHSLEELGRQVAEVIDAYTLTSRGLREAISGRLNENPLDDDARTRLADALAIDTKASEQLALLQAIQEPPRPGGAGATRALSNAEAADLGDDLDTAAQGIFADLRNGNRVPTVGRHLASGSPSVRPYVKRMLDESGKDMIKTLASAVPFAHELAGVLAGAGERAGLWDEKSLKRLERAARWLDRARLKLWGEVIAKIRLLLGRDTLAAATEIGDPSDLLDELAGNGASRALVRLLKVESPVRRADWAISKHPSLAGRAVDACEDVEEHHQRRRRAMPWANRALAAGGKLSLLHGGAGVGVGALAGGALLMYSFWNAHDHVDSPVAGQVRIPGNPGILSSVNTALGIDPGIDPPQRFPPAPPPETGESKAPSPEDAAAEKRRRRREKYREIANTRPRLGP